MNQPKATRVCVVRSPRGLHMRPWGEFVQIAHRYTAKVEVINGSVRAQADSLVQLMGLAAGEGARLVLESEGPGSDEAVGALAEYVESLFEEIETTENGKSA